MKKLPLFSALAATAAMGLSGQSMAAVTKATEIITNQVTLTYEIGTVGQSPIQAQTQLQVDTKVDMTLALASAAIETDVKLNTKRKFSYTLTNTGNADQYYQLSMANLTTGTDISGGSTDDADISTPTYQFYSDDPAITGNTVTSGTEITNNRLEIPALTNQALSANPTRTIWVVVDVPSTGLSNGDLVGLEARAIATDSSGTKLTASTGVDKNASANIAGASLIVFADATTQHDVKWNGEVTAYNGLEISTGELTDPDYTGPGTAPAAPLTAKVVNDPICIAPAPVPVTAPAAAPAADAALPTVTYVDHSVGSGNDCTVTAYRPKAIPGALVEFNYRAQNTGSDTVEKVGFAYTLPAEYLDSSIANVKSEIGSTTYNAACLASAPGTPTVGQCWIVSDVLNVYVGDVVTDAVSATNSVFRITFTAVIE